MMLAGLPVILAMAAAQAAAAANTNGSEKAAPGAATPAAQTQGPAAPSRQIAGSCPPVAPDSTTIVICTERPRGYRLNPDLIEAKRETRSAGRPVRPGGGTPRPDCATVGPQPCVNAGINLLAAALTAAEMAKRVAAGQEIGSMFVTDPQPDEYHLYLMAKARREAKEAQKAATAKAKAAAAAAPQQAPAQTDGN
jgi:hypothetical protein